MNIQLEIALLAFSILFFVSILAGKASSRFGVPALLLFLVIGMVAGSDGIGITFENIGVANTIGTIALCVILFSGGMDTKFQDIKPIIAQGVTLATLGVLMTALLTGVIIWWVLGATPRTANVGLVTSLLLAATMSSTDSASVFSILRSRGVSLKNNLKPMLELESGSNDPMAYVLVITLIEIIKMGTTPNYALAIGMLVLQLVIGAGAGYLLGKLAVFTLNHIKIGNDSLYPILVFTFCIFIFSLTYFIKGNGFLAVYVGGLIIGNSRFIHKRSSLNFFDGLAWMFQLIMFLTLGLLVNPSQLIPMIIPALLVSFLMIFITRPLTVFLCLLPFRKMPLKDKTFISWVGLRGAVPIIFAIIPLAQDVPNAQVIFNVVFVCTLVSLLVQGTSIPLMAKWLHVADDSVSKRKASDFDVDFSSDIKSETCEIEITEDVLKHGRQLMHMQLPDNTLVVMVKRDKTFFVPTGKTILKEKDKLLIITDDHEALMETYKNLGIKV